MDVSSNDEGRRTQAQRRATTRRALLDAARSLFAEKGYHGAAAEEVGGRAGLTRGALSHPLEDKGGPLPSGGRRDGGRDRRGDRGGRTRAARSPGGRDGG